MIEASGAATFAFTKLVVHDLVREATLYRAVCSYTVDDVVKADTAGRPIEELVLRTPDGALDMVLLTHPGEPAPSRSGGVITAFDTHDLESFQGRVLQAGGTIVQAIQSVDVGRTRMRIGFFAGPEGHLLEVIER